MRVWSGVEDRELRKVWHSSVKALVVLCCDHIYHGARKLQHVPRKVPTLCATGCSGDAIALKFVEATSAGRDSGIQECNGSLNQSCKKTTEPVYRFHHY